MHLARAIRALGAFIASLYIASGGVQPCVRLGGEKEHEVIWWRRKTILRLMGRISRTVLGVSASRELLRENRGISTCLEPEVNQVNQLEVAENHYDPGNRPDLAGGYQLQIPWGAKKRGCVRVVELEISQQHLSVVCM